MSFESRLLTVERLLSQDDGLGDLAKQLLQALRDQSQQQGGGNCPDFTPALYITCVDGGGAYPTSAQINVYYPVQAVGLTGSFAAGAAPTLTPYGDIHLAYNDGDTYIPQGQDVVGLWVDPSQLVIQFWG